jgi:hypothetical protein
MVFSVLLLPVSDLLPENGQLYPLIKAVAQ